MVSIVTVWFVRSWWLQRRGSLFHWLEHMPEVFKMGRNVLEKSVGLNFKGLGPLAKSATSSLHKYGNVVIWSAPVLLSSFKYPDILADFFCRAVWDMVVKTIGVILRTVFEAGARGWLRTLSERFGEFCLLIAYWNHSQEKVLQWGVAIKDVFM